MICPLRALGSRFEAIIHAFRAGCRGEKAERPTLLHIHAVGPALLVPVAKMLESVEGGDDQPRSPDYEREKWGKAAKAIGSDARRSVSGQKKVCPMR